MDYNFSRFALTYDEWLEQLIENPETYGYTPEQAADEYQRFQQTKCRLAGNED